jgi:tRNA(fMet)-specific endonuclease VapC
VKKIVLDTNGYTAFLAGDPKILDALATAEIVFLSVFVLGELFAGFKGGSREAANRELLERFLKKPTVQVLNATAETASVFGQLKAALKKAGTPLPINDVWIAAHAVETGAILVSYDSHFEKIIGLKIWQPHTA